MEERSGENGSLPAAGEGASVFVQTNGVRLHTVQAGPDDGPLVILLHGFPEFWYGWHEAIAPLADAGYRVVVPDQRGYNHSEKPADVTAYRIDELAADVTGLVDVLGHDEAHVVGHDWGAAVAWWTALYAPGHVRTCAAVNVPHPSVMWERLRNSWRQRLKSWYFLLFQLPVVPEMAARAWNFRPLVETMRRSSRPGTFTARDFERYRAAWRQPGALRAMVNWYRALVRERLRPQTERVDPPTLVLWGARDQFLDRSMASASAEKCRDGRLEVLPEATHWIHHEQPERVVSLLRKQFER